MKNYILVIILILSSTARVISQEIPTSRDNLNFYRNYKMKAGEWKNIVLTSNVEGSPYLNDEFKKGKISTKAKQEFDDVLLRYNIFSDEIEFKTPENEVRAFTNPEMIERIIFENIEMEYLAYSNARKIQKGYLKVIMKGKATLYARSQVLLTEATKGDNYTKGEPAKFLPKDDSYYIQTGSGPARKISGKKDLITCFPKQNKEIETYIKKNKIKHGKLEDLKELVQYYNSLE